MPTGKVLDPYYIAEYFHESVAVVAVRSQREVLLLRMWRPISEQLGWEVPAGLVEPGEVVAEAAKRELLEETGLQVAAVEAVGWVYPSNASSTERVHLFVGLDPKLVGAEAGDSEVSEMYWLSASEARELIRKQEIKDGISLTALLLAFHLGYILV
jgi:ADP-ribose pyrophosphatase